MESTARTSSHPTGGDGAHRPSRRMAALATIAAVVLASLAVPLAAAVPAGAAGRVPSGPAVLSGRTSKLSPRLQQLAQPSAQALSSAQQSQAVGLAEGGPGSLMTRSGGRIVVSIRFDDTSASTLAAVATAGVSDLSLSVPDGVADGTIDPAALPALAAVGGVASVVEELTPMVDSPAAGIARANTGGGAVTSVVPPCPTGLVSEGDAQLKANTARTTFGVDGTGVKVGVLSDSFNVLGGAAADVTAAELPGTTNTCGYTTPVQVQADAASGEDEGRAMAQIVHDLAPGSPLAFATAFNGSADMANQIRNLRTNGASVIVDDVTYFGEPMFQDGIIAKAVDDVVAGGATYYSSAANNTLTIGGHDVTSYESGAFRPTPCPTAVNTAEGLASQCHNFNQSGTDNGDTITLANGYTTRMSLSYSQPQGGVTTDLDVFLVDAGTGAVLASATSSNKSTEDPFEFISYTNSSGVAKSVRVVVARYQGTGGGDAGTPRFKFTFFPNGAPSITSVQYNVTTGNDIVGPTIIGHNGASRTASVAAVPYSSVAPFSPESYSSHGPLEKCWGPTMGTAPTYSPPASAIVPCATKTVDFAATDGGINNFFPPGTGPPFRFYGTSAAAPHAAAVGALARQKYPCRTPDEILAAQRSSAVAMPYPVDTVGSGLVDANAMLTALTPCTPPGAPTGVTAIAGNGAATVKWVAPASTGSSPITSYTVTANPGGHTCGWTTGALTCQVTGLTNGSTYTFSVVAASVSGSSPSSVASAALLVGAPVAPAGVAAVPGNGSMTVKWLTPNANGSPLTGYIITPYFLGVAQATVPAGAGATSVVIPSLVNGRNYAYKVQATNAVGTSAYSLLSSVVKVGTPTPPGFPSAVSGDTQVTLHWLASSPNASAVTGYIVTPYLGLVAQPSVTFNSTALTQVITGLTDGKTYMFKVAGINAIGTGPASMTASIVVGAPVAPTGVTAVTGVGQATVSWTAPANNGSPITGYVVTPYIGAVAQLPRTFVSVAVSQIVTGLTSGQTYTFKVSAINARGTGLKSLASNAVGVT